MTKKDRIALKSIRTIVVGLQGYVERSSRFTFDQHLALGNILLNVDAILSRGEEYDK